MKGGGNLLPSSEAAVAATSQVFPAANAGLFGKGRFKFWALAAMLLLAFWSVLAGIVTLRWSAKDLNRDFDDAPVHPDLDILETEAREEVVRHLWDVYAHNLRIRLPKFWQEAFKAAYEELAGDDPAARDAAVAEIARMSVQMIDREAPTRNTKTAETERNQRVGGGMPTMKSTFLSSIKA